MKRPQGGFAEVYAAGAWLWLGGNLLLLAGSLGSLGPGTLASLALLIGTGLLLLGLRALSARRAIAGAVRAHPALACALALVGLAILYLGLSPPVARDALIHHLALPRLFLDAGRIVDVPFAIHAAYPQTVDMLYLLPVGLGADWAAAWIHFGLGALAAAVLAVRARRWGGDRAGLLAALLFLSLPVVVRLAGAAYVDLGLCLYTFLAVECALRWREAGARGGWLALSALAVGFGLSTKYQAFLVAALLGAVIVIAALRSAGPTRAARSALVFGLLVILPATPWLGRNLRLHHNPVYPLFTHSFGGTPEQEAEQTHPLVLRRIVYGESPARIAALPLRIFFSGQPGDPRRFDGRLNPFLPLLAGAALVLFRRERRLPGAGTVMGLAVLGTLLVLGTQVARVRYVLPFVGLLCPLGGAALASVRGRSLTGAMFAGAMAWNGIFLLHTLREADLHRYLAGGETREAYLERRLPAYPLYVMANARVAAGGRVQLLFMGDQAYHLSVPYTYEAYFSGAGLAEALARGPSAAAAYFRKRGVTHFLVNEVLLRRYLDGRSDGAGASGFEAFARAWTRKLDRVGAYALYEIVKGKQEQGLGSGETVKIGAFRADKSGLGS